jgi:hypothetical protein
MGAGGRPFGPSGVLMLMGISRGACAAGDFFQGTGYHHFGLIAALFTFADLLDGFHFITHANLLSAFA